MLFKPSDNLTDIPGWENKILGYLKEKTKAQAGEISLEISLSLTDTLYILERLGKNQRVQLTRDARFWRLTAQERIRQRRSAS